MADGRRRDNWDRHSHLLSLIANCNRGPDSQPFEAAEFNPYEIAKAKKKKAAPKQKISLLQLAKSWNIKVTPESKRIVEKIQRDKDAKLNG